MIRKIKKNRTSVTEDNKNREVKKNIIMIVT